MFTPTSAEARPYPNCVVKVPILVNRNFEADRRSLVQVAEGLSEAAVVDSVLR
jgi:hypothetical protein